MNFIYNALNSRQLLLNMLIQDSVGHNKEIHIKEVYVENRLLQIIVADNVVGCIITHDNNGRVNFYEKKNKVEENVHEVIRRFIERNVQFNGQGKESSNIFS